MDKFFNNQYLLNLIIKWRKHLIIIALAAIILSIVFSSPFFIKPKYKSYATIYPSNLVSYSSETVTEQMLQIFKSEDIRDAVVKKLNLIKHYDIDTTEKYHYTNLIHKWESNVSINKTEFETVKIEVLDIDPVIACKILNEMIDLFNIKVRTMFRVKKAEMVKTLENQLNIKKVERDTLKAKLFRLSTQYHLIDYTEQSKEATREYVRTGSKSTNAAMIVKNLETKGAEFRVLSAQFENAINTYNNLKLEYETDLKDLTKELTYTNLVDKPFPSDKKCYPVRWLIVIISTLGALLLGFLSILFVEKIKNNLTN